MALVPAVTVMLPGALALPPLVPTSVPLLQSKFMVKLYGVVPMLTPLSLAVKVKVQVSDPPDVPYVKMPLPFSTRLSSTVLAAMELNAVGVKV